MHLQYYCTYTTRTVLFTKCFEIYVFDDFFSRSVKSHTEINLISKENGLGDAGIEFGDSKADVNIWLQKYQLYTQAGKQ